MPLKDGYQTEESNRKNSEAHKGKPATKGSFETGHIAWNKGKTGLQHFSEEAKKKKSDSHRGKTLSDEQKKKIAESLKGRPLSEKARKNISLALRGKHHTRESRKKMSQSKKGPIPWIKGRKHTLETRKMLSESLKGRKLSESHKKNISLNRPEFFGEKHPRWKGGKKLNKARTTGKRRMRGFILLFKNNPYSEPIDYHHIHPDLPYVIPCPRRIHKIFGGRENTHFQNVNAMLGFKFEVICQQITRAYLLLQRL